MTTLMAVLKPYKEKYNEIKHKTGLKMLKVVAKSVSSPYMSNLTDVDLYCQDIRREGLLRDTASINSVLHKF